MKVIVAGGRDFYDYSLLKVVLDDALSEMTNIEIVSGGANGADKLGERYAAEHGYPLSKFPAEWDRWGKRAGFMRNAEMAKYADVLVAFWNGSKGTMHMINLAQQYNLKVCVIAYP